MPRKYEVNVNWPIPIRRKPNRPWASTIGADSRAQLKGVNLKSRGAAGHPSIKTRATRPGRVSLRAGPILFPIIYATNLISGQREAIAMPGRAGLALSARLAEAIGKANARPWAVVG